MRIQIFPFIFFIIIQQFIDLVFFFFLNYVTLKKIGSVYFLLLVVEGESKLGFCI